MSSSFKILITGAAGFIGHALCKRLLSTGLSFQEDFQDGLSKDPEKLIIVGLDNLNDYYDPDLKYARLEDLGVNRQDIEWNKLIPVSSSFSFIKANIEDDEEMDRLFQTKKFDLVIHLAAQPGIRYSLDHPRQYIKSNIDGFINILEGCRNSKVKHLIYASSSSVYGLNGKVPFSEHDPVDHPISLYAATKRSDELMAHVYSHLYNLPTTGLRFFTVYGPWGRPDMSPYLFIDAVLNDRPIKVFNNGDMLRDFTYIDDIIESIVRLIDNIPQGLTDKKAPLDPASSPAPFRIFNIGNSKPINLKDYIKIIEMVTGKEAKKECLPKQPGDVYQTFADTTDLEKTTGFKPCTTLQEGITKTLEWFKHYHQKT